MMINNDTIRLLRECSAGVEMGISAIDEVLPKVEDERLAELLGRSLDENENISSQIAELLDKYGDEEKEPNPMAKGMSWLKTNVSLAFDRDDATVASLMTDGCDMGVKSLSRYLNQYAAADEKSKELTKRLISAEQRLSEDLRDWL